MTYRSLSCNLCAPGTEGDNSRTVNFAAQNADVISFQKAQDRYTQSLIKELPEFDSYIPLGLPSWNPIAWRRDVFEIFNNPGWYKILDNKPDRSMTYAPLIEKLTRLKVLEICIHMIAKASALHPPEREEEWYTSVDKVAANLLALEDRFPQVPMVIKGDWHRGPFREFPDIIERVVNTPPNLGGSRYDRFYLLGPVQGTDPFKIPIPSDHDAVAIRATLIPPPKASGPNKVQIWRAMVEEANRLPFPSLLERADAFAMRTSVIESL